MLKKYFTLFFISSLFTASCFGQNDFLGKFTNHDSIVIPDFGASPNLYPSQINVSGIKFNAVSFRLSLTNIYHYGDATDIDILLEMPDGRRFVLMSDVELKQPIFYMPILTFNSKSAIPLYSLNFDPTGNTEYWISNYGSTSDQFPGVGFFAPTSSIGIGDHNPNGTWKLYVVGDTQNGQSGRIATGWEISFYGQKFNCTQPEPPSIVSVADSSVTLNIKEDVQAPNRWQLAYVAKNVNGLRTDTFVVNHPGLVTIDKLFPGALYEISMRKICSDDDPRDQSSWSPAVEFTTKLFPCKYAKPIQLCERITASHDMIPRYPITTCSYYGGGDKIFRRFSPPKTGQYWVKTRASNVAIAYTAYRGACEVDTWHCAPGDNENNFSLGVLSKDSTYLIVYDRMQSVSIDFQISECPIPELSLVDAALGPFEGTLKINRGNNLVNGTYDLLYGSGVLPLPPHDTVPTTTNLLVTQGKVPLTNLVPATPHQLHLRLRCEPDKKSCWQGPLSFRPEPYCGKIELKQITQTAGAFVETKWERGASSWTKFRYRPRYPKPGQTDTSFIEKSWINSYDLETYLFNHLKLETEYIVYAQAICETQHQPWQGPFYIRTNSDCFLPVKDLYCEQVILHEFEIQPPIKPLISANENDQFYCGIPYKEHLYRFKASGEHTGLKVASRVGGGPSVDPVSIFSIKKASKACDLEDWQYIACLSKYWQEPKYFLTEKDTTYYILIRDWFGRGYYDFKLFSCENPCKAPQNFKASKITARTAELSWEKSEDFEQTHWQVRWYSNQTDKNEIFVERASALSLKDLHPNTSYTVLIKSHCLSNLEGDWDTLVFQTRDTFHLALSGKFNHNHPFFVKPGGLPNQPYLYEQMPFAVAGSGQYRLEAQLGIGKGCNLLLYRSNFDPKLPLQNLIGTAESVHDSVSTVLMATLQPNETYILIVATRSPTNIRFLESFSKILVLGPNQIIAKGESFNGLAPGPYGEIPPTNGKEVIADYKRLDRYGWLHYYDHGTDLQSPYDDLLVFSAQYNINYYYDNFDQLPRINGTAGTSKITNPPAQYVKNPTGWFVMNRFWDFPVPDFYQPQSGMKVRFYFTRADFDSVKTIITRNGGTPPQKASDLHFYKINDFSNLYDPDPSKGHALVPTASAYDQDGYWEYAPGDSATTKTWLMGSYKNNYYAEMLVKRFSGGGGGLAGKYGGGALTPTRELANGKWKVYPLPFNHYLNVESTQTTDPDLNLLQVRDGYGRIVYSQKDFSLGHSFQIPTHDLIPGIYFLELTTNENIYTMKLIKQ